MIKRIKGLSRGKKLAICCAVILILLPLIWMMLDFPPLTERMEFRWTMAEHGFPDKSPELIVELFYTHTSDRSEFYADRRVVGFRADRDYVYVAKLGEENEDRDHPAAWCVPAVDDVLYTPLDWWVYDCMSPLKGRLDDVPMFYFSQSHIPAFAVKAPSAYASLTLILENCHDQEGKLTAGGRFPLVLDQAENGWFIFRWDTRVIAIQSGAYDESRYIDGRYRFSSPEMETLKGQFHAPYVGLVEWLKTYDFTGTNSSATAYLELTTRDEAGNVVKQVSWELP